MANTGRTVNKYARLYLGNASLAVDLSCHVMQLGQLGVDWEYRESVGLCWSIKGGLLDRAVHSVGPINAMMAAGVAGDLHTTLTALQGVNVYMAAALGIRQLPTFGTPAFVTCLPCKRYAGLDDGGLLAMTIDFASAHPADVAMNYDNPWGAIIHPLQEETAANTGTTDVIDNAAASAKGGYLFYALTAVDAGTAALSVDDSADGTNYSALSGATSGALSAPAAGIVQLGVTATVRRYLRWQITLAGGASAATFLTAFVRG